MRLDRAGGRTPPGVQLGFLWGGTAAASLAVLALPGGWLRSVAAELPPCPFRAVTSIPCPACGTGRAVLALSRLDLASAFRWNPLATAAALVFLAGGLVALAAAARGRGVPELPLPPGWQRAAVVVAVALSWAWLVADGR